MTGGKAARWNDEDMADTSSPARPSQFIERQQGPARSSSTSRPTTSTSRACRNARFAGKSGCGPRGDVDPASSTGRVGEVLGGARPARAGREHAGDLHQRQRPGRRRRLRATAPSENLSGHTPAGPFRGGKYSTFEGGTRVPFIVRWPGQVTPGTTSEGAGLPGGPDGDASRPWPAASCPADAGPDSFNVLPALLGESKAGRDTLVEQGGGVQTAMRKGQWKFIPQGAAPAGAPRAPAQAPRTQPVRPGGNAGPVIDRPENDGGPILYDLAKDLAEKQNVAAGNPEVVKELRTLLRQSKETERTRP